MCDVCSLGLQVQYSANSSDPAVSIRVQITRLLPMPQLVAGEQQALFDIHVRCGPQRAPANPAVSIRVLTTRLPHPRLKHRAGQAAASSSGCRSACEQQALLSICMQCGRGLRLHRLGQDVRAQPRQGSQDAV